MYDYVYKSLSVCKCVWILMCVYKCVCVLMCIYINV